MKRELTYKLTVPADVEEKIRYLLRKFPSTEWSGVLFYTHEGSFENGDLHIICKDIYPMDLGNATFTSFSMNEDVANYMAENIELFDCDTGLIHSHHTMSTFFSGTDTSTLQKEGNDTNCFVSLIVNNAGVYSAAVTRKIQTKSEVTVKSLGTSYEFFGNGAISTSADPTAEKTSIIDKEIIEYYMLDVTREETSNPLAYLDDRFTEIEKKKSATSISTVSTKDWKDWLNDYKGINSYDGKSYSSYGNWYNDGVIASKSDSQKSLWDDDWNYYDQYNISDKKDNDKKSSKTKKDKEDVPFKELDKTLMDKCISTIVTGSLLHLSDNTGKFDWKKFIKKDMDKYYEKIFTETISYAMDPFELWSDFIVEFVIRHCEIVTGDSNIAGDLAFYILDELNDYRDNPYIDEYCKIFENYLES